MLRPHYRAYRTQDGTREELFHSSNRAMSESIIRMCRARFPDRAYTLIEEWEGTAVELLPESRTSAA